MPVVKQMQNYKDEVSKEQQFKPRLFTYPDFSKSSTIFDEDDLQNGMNLLMVLCVRANPDRDIQEDSVHVWRGGDFEEEDSLSS